MSVRDGDETGEMTLAFELSAIRAFADPAAVVEEAREWSRYVGVVGNDADAVASYVADRGLRQDFDLDEGDVWLTMEGIREAADTDRHVFVGTGPEDRRVAEHLGWEYRHVTEVAEKAGWALERDAADETGLVDRLRRLSPGSLWPF